MSETAIRHASEIMPAYYVPLRLYPHSHCKDDLGIVGWLRVYESISALRKADGNDCEVLTFTELKREGETR